MVWRGVVLVAVVAMAMAAAAAAEVRMVLGWLVDWRAGGWVGGGNTYDLAACHAVDCRRLHKRHGKGLGGVSGDQPRGGEAAGGLGEHLKPGPEGQRHGVAAAHPAELAEVREGAQALSEVHGVTSVRQQAKAAI